MMENACRYLTVPGSLCISKHSDMWNSTKVEQNLTSTSTAKTLIKFELTFSNMHVYTWRLPHLKG